MPVATRSQALASGAARRPARRRLRARDLRALGLGRERKSRHVWQPAGKIEALRIGLVGSSVNDSAPGGGEIQLGETLAALQRYRTNASLWSSEHSSLDEVDCLHLFGSHRQWLPLVRAAHRAGKKVALSTIAWFDLASRWRESAPLCTRLRGVLGHLVRTACPGWPGWRSELYHTVDVLLPNSHAEAAQLVRYFRIPRQKIRVVPNGADPSFAVASPLPFATRVGGPGFVLCAGRIEPRKNQLELIHALAGLETRLVLLGNVVPGHENYLAECRRAAGSNVCFFPGLDHADPLLASALAACGCLVLPSWFETPGLAALEAAMSGTPLVLTDRGATAEYFGTLAQYVSPADRPGLRTAVERALAAGRNPVLAEMALQRYTWDAAAKATREAYATLI